MNSNNYPLTLGGEIIPILDMGSVPVHCNVLWQSSEVARNAPRGEIRLGYFPASGHLYNLTFDPDRMAYTPAYENALDFSPRFRQYATAMAERLIRRYELREKTIVEIGAGQGDFLKMLARLGDNQGVGFDPSYDPEMDDDPLASVSFVRDFFGEKFADYPADAIICRHVLEHIAQPEHFLSLVRRVVGNRTDTLVFFEVPNALWTVQEMGIWDLIYEHCSYFTPHSLRSAFHQAGFDILALNPTFGGQFLTIEAYPRAGGKERPPLTNDDALATLEADVRSFGDRYQQKVTEWRGRLDQLRQSGRHAVIWGSGSKGVTFMNIMQAGETVPFAVDINPRKQGKYISGTGQPIVAPDELTVIRPDTVIIMNQNYRDEIAAHLDQLGVDAETLVA